jgi:hypothetical protein
VQADLYYSSLYGKEYARSLKVVGVRAKKPDVAADQEAIEISIELPSNYFEEQNPKVHVQVPNRPAAQAQATTVTAHVKPKAPSAAAAIIHGS